MFEDEDILENMLCLPLKEAQEDDPVIDGVKGFYLGKFSKSDYRKLKAIADMWEPGKQFKFRRWVKIAILYFLKCEYDGVKPKKS